MAKTNPKETIEGEVVEALEMQRQLDDVEATLMKIEAFQTFINLRKAVNERMSKVRKDVEAVMVPAYIAGDIDKTLKGDWGSVTVTESDQFEVDEKVLPPKFFKKVVDMTKIRGTFQLEGKPPKGTKPTKKYGIMMKFK